MNIDNRVKEFQKENLNICNVLEAATDAISTSVEGLSLGSLILMACEIPYAATATFLAYGVKCAVHSPFIKKGGIEFVIKHTEDETLKQNFENSTYHLLGIIDKAASLKSKKKCNKTHGNCR